MAQGAMRQVSQSLYNVIPYNVIPSRRSRPEPMPEYFIHRQSE